MTGVPAEALSSVIAAWLPDRRWYGGKGRPVTGVTIASDVVLLDSESTLHHLIVAVSYTDGPDEHYQVPVGIADTLSESLTGAVIGEAEGSVVYDATVDPVFSNLLLRLLADEATVGPLTFHIGVPSPDGEPLDTELHGRLLGAEQSNTSLLYGEAYVGKLFRRLARGRNPDLDVSLALARVGDTAVPPPLGWAEVEFDGAEATLFLVQPYLRLATDGWALATTSVRDLFGEADLHADEVGGDFAGESMRLGTTTAEVHADLARAFPTAVAGAKDIAALATGMARRLEEAVALVPELAPHTEPIKAAYDDLRRETQTEAIQRIHGDLHLGQVLRTDTGWSVLDFEGEPAKPLSERIRPDSPLRDVAGMLRSFDYAAHHLLADGPADPQLAYRATEWAERNREAFCDGYAERSGADPRKSSTILRAYELDKAVYEVVYEARNRPAWLPIPLGAIARLTA